MKTSYSVTNGVRVMVFNATYNNISAISWSWLYSSWICNFLCNQYLLQLTLWVRTRSGGVYSRQHYVNSLWVTC